MSRKRNFENQKFAFILLGKFGNSMQNLEMPSPSKKKQKWEELTNAANSVKKKQQSMKLNVL